MKKKLQTLAVTSVIGGIALISQWTFAAEAATRSDQLQRGEAIYKKQCVSCHGEMGVGVAGSYEQALIGDASVGELTSIITRTMPEGEPEACVGEDAAAVAAYIHETFYGRAAQIKNRPPKVLLARLTAEQLRQSISDLYASYEGIADLKKEQGLRGIYFDGEQWKEDKKKIERDDATINFDWGHDSPGEGIQPKEFYIHWQGGLIAEKSGRYEIVVRSTCSFVMDFGRDGRRFIDNHVQSGDKTEFRQTIQLTGGRVYYLKIDLRQRERKTEQPPAKISLSWVPPNGVEEIVPAKNLRPGWCPPAYALQASLPPDDRTYGYDRGIAVNRQWDESTTAAALEFAGVMNDELWPSYLRKTKKDESDQRVKLRNFLVEFVERAFRSKLTEEEQSRYIDQHINVTEDISEAIHRVALVALKSPRFLYPALAETDSESQRVATRLALLLHDSLPADEWLRKRMDGDQLKNVDEVRNSARRMLNDYRAKAKVRDMLYEWLDLKHLTDITKDPETYPGFNAELVADLRTSLDMFLEDVVWSDNSDFRQFFTTDWAYTSPRLAEFYGDSWKAADASAVGMAKSVSDPEKRFGILTHPLLTSGRAYFQTTSPIHRGVYLTRYVFGRTIRPPNDAFSPLSPDLHPDLTTRERVGLQTSDANCQVCHARINNLGFVLENYDAVGRFRSTERDKPIDASGYYLTSDDQEIKVSGAKDLANFLVQSEDARSAFVERAFEHFVKQPMAAYGIETAEQLKRKFSETNCNVRELLVEIAVIAATSPRPFEEKDPTS